MEKGKSWGFFLYHNLNFTNSLVWWVPVTAQTGTLSLHTSHQSLCQNVEYQPSHLNLSYMCIEYFCIGSEELTRLSQMAVFTLLLSYSALQVWLLVKADRSFGDKYLREILIWKIILLFQEEKEKNNQTPQKQKNRLSQTSQFQIYYIISYSMKIATFNYSYIQNKSIC